MHQRVCAIGMTQPKIKRQIPVGRHQIRVVVNRAGIHLIAPCRLDAYKSQAKTQARNHHPGATVHRVSVRHTPTLNHRLAIGLGQLIEHRPVVIQRQTLLTRAQIKALEIVGHASQQRLNQFSAAFRQHAINGITLRLQSAQDIQRRRRRIEPHAVTDSPITGWVVSQNQRYAFVWVGHTGQFHPAPCQLSHEIHTLGLRAITHHVRLATLTAPGQILEADGPADDSPI